MNLQGTARALRSLGQGLVLCSILVHPVLTATADDQTSDSPSHLLGDWGGARPSLQRSGITVESVLTLDLAATVDGGVSQNSGVLGNYDFTVEVDTEAAGLWSGGTLFAYVLGNFGFDPSVSAGDVQVSSNIEAPSAIKLYEFWYDHQLVPDTLSWLIGLHDYNSEFDALEYAGTLRNSSFGISVDISQVGPSIFPTTALATRVRVLPTERSYLQVAAYDGVPGDPENPRGTHVILDSDDGIFWAAEAGLLGDSELQYAGYYKLALGGWLLDQDFEDPFGTERSKNEGVYLIGESALLSEEDPAQGLGAFFQVGFARADRNEIGRYFGAGLVYTGLISGRDEDATSFGIAHARRSSEFRNLNGGSDAAETALELTYRSLITPYLSLQPDLQYVINPGTDPALDDALIASVRIELAM